MSDTQAQPINPFTLLESIEIAVDSAQQLLAANQRGLVERQLRELLFVTQQLRQSLQTLLPAHQIALEGRPIKRIAPDSEAT